MNERVCARVRAHAEWDELQLASAAVARYKARHDDSIDLAQRGSAVWFGSHRVFQRQR